MNNQFRPVYPVQKPAENITISLVPDFSFDKAMPQSAAAIDDQIDRDDAGDDFIEEELHSKHPLIRCRLDG
jgi:hypothetical protein